jgi:hypothetical protein
MSAWVRAKFQTRTSLICPPKNPAAVPPDVMAEAMPKCWRLWARGGWPTASCASRLPSR